MVLEEFGVEEERLLALIEKLIAPPDTGTAVAERAPEYSPRARKIINNAAKESEIRHGKGIGTEHLMIAVLKETDCVATRLLYTLGVNIQKLFAGVLSAMGMDAEAIEEEFQSAKTAKTEGLRLHQRLISIAVI